jgi:hypothetical protein
MMCLFSKSSINVINALSCFVNSKIKLHKWKGLKFYFLIQDIHSWTIEKNSPKTFYPYLEN